MSLAKTFRDNPQRRYIMFGGKGGLGKTTFSAATGYWLAKQGKRVLVFSVDPQASLSDIFQKDIFGKGALRYAVELHPSAILIVGALGGRLDQTIANLSILTDPMLPKIDIHLDDGVEQAFFCRASAGEGKRVEVRGRSGDTVSLIPWQTPVDGVTTEGLQWPLYGETLYPDKSRGVSNRMLGESALVKIEKGLLLIILRRQPELKS